MGVTYLIQGDEPAAIEKFKTAIKLDSTNFESNMNLGYVALNSGDYALAKTVLRGGAASPTRAASTPSSGAGGVPAGGGRSSS